jgi:hypothetical protein
VYVNEGLSVLRRRALRLVPDGETVSQEEFYQALIARGELLAYETQQRFYEVGSLRGIEEFQQAMAQGVRA